MVIRAELYDTGTRLIKASHLNKPGMEQAYFREIDMEYDWPQERTTEIQRAILGTEKRVDLAPWPERFPGVMWVDYNAKYRGDFGGLQLGMYNLDLFSYEWDPVPKNTSQILPGEEYSPDENRADARMGDLHDVDGVAASQPEPTEWLRLPLLNETGSTTDLQTPATLIQECHTGGAFALDCNYSPLFMPFDTREPDLYTMIDDDGNPVSEEDKIAHMALSEGAFYRLYLMPAKWRWGATVVAHYTMITWFNVFPTSEIFTKAWFNRPPIYPIRHNVMYTKDQPMFEYNWVPHSYDTGVNSGFDRSRGSATLRFWIIDAQWWTLSSAYIFTGNDDCSLVIWQHPPDPGDIVLGIGRVDYPGGQEERLWLVQKEDVSTRWPNTVVGIFLVPFRVSAY